MRIEIRIDQTCKEPYITVTAPAVTEEIETLIKKLSQEEASFLPGFCDNGVTMLEPAEIFSVFSSDGKVFAATEKGEFQLRLRLYEAEERLTKKQFVRISQSEIINMKKVKNFDVSLSGTIRVKMKNGTETYVSRRYVTKIKRVLGL